MGWPQMEVIDSVVVLWAGLALLCGVVLGAFWGDLRQRTRSQALVVACDRVRSLDAKADHYRFGISDLQVRVDAANNEIAMLRADLKVRRATYERLNEELRSRWDEAVECKRTLAAQESDALALEREIANWKEKLDSLYQRMEQGAVTDRTLKRELASGLSAIFEEAGDELPTVQRLLLQRTIEIGMSNTDNQGFEEIIKLLSARIELLESQVRYWQDRSTAEGATPADADKIKEAKGGRRPARAVAQQDDANSGTVKSGKAAGRSGKASRAPAKASRRMSRKR